MNISVPILQKSIATPNPLFSFSTNLILLCHITDKSTAVGGMTSNRLENKTNIKRLSEWLI
jgi:hypothetical protein